MHAVGTQLRTDLQGWYRRYRSPRRNGYHAVINIIPVVQLHRRDVVGLQMYGSYFFHVLPAGGIADSEEIRGDCIRGEYRMRGIKDQRVRNHAEAGTGKQQRAIPAERNGWRLSKKFLG